MRHPVVINPVRLCRVNMLNAVSWEAGVSGYPPELLLLWLSTSYRGSIVGAHPTYSGEPVVVDSDGVTPGKGPNFTAISDLATKGTLLIRFTATTASVDLTAEHQVFGPIYATPTGLLLRVGDAVAEFETSWVVGEVVTAAVQIDGGKMRIGRA